MWSDAVRATLVDPRLPAGRWRTLLMGYYRRKLFEAASALVGKGDLNLRLTQVAGFLLQIDDDDVPASALEAFERVRDPLIAKPMIAHGDMVPRDLGEQEAKAAALGVLDLLVTELAGL